MSDPETAAGSAAAADSSFDPAAAGWEPYGDDGFIGLVGPFWARPSGDSYLYAFKAEHKHHNRRGIVQGGMLMTFADRAMGMTCWYANERQPQATVHLDVHFVEAVQIGESMFVTPGKIAISLEHVIADDGLPAHRTRVVASELKIACVAKGTSRRNERDT